MKKLLTILFLSVIVLTGSAQSYQSGTAKPTTEQTDTIKQCPAIALSTGKQCKRRTKGVRCYQHELIFAKWTLCITKTDFSDAELHSCDKLFGNPTFRYN